MFNLYIFKDFVEQLYKWIDRLIFCLFVLIIEHKKVQSNNNIILIQFIKQLKNLLSA